MGDIYCVIVRYEYYKYNPNGKLKYEYETKDYKTGERITPMVNSESRFKMNNYNASKCLFIDDITISEWYSNYKKSIETTGYTEGVFDKDRENRIIYCKDNDGEYRYYKMEHGFDCEPCKESIWAIINEEGYLWNPDQIYNYYFPELDECNQPTGRYFVREKDINPMSPTYTHIRITETIVTEGIIRTEKDGEHSNKYIKPEGYDGKDLMDTE